MGSLNFLTILQTTQIKFLEYVNTKKNMTKLEDATLEAM